MAKQAMRLRGSVQLAVRVMAFSTVGVAGALLFLWLPTRYVLAQYLSNMDMASMEAAVDPIVKRRDFVDPMTPLERRFLVDLSVTVPRAYHTVCALLYFRLPPARLAGVVLGLAVLLGAASLYVAYVDVMVDVGSMLPTVFGPVLLSYALPRGNTYLSLGLLQGLGLMVTLTILVILSRVPPTDDGNKMLLSCTFFPALREFVYSMSRFSARKLMLHRQPGGPGSVRRHFVWVFVIWAQLGVALLMRMFFSGFNSTFYLVMTVSVQSAFEIASRLTIDWRDSMVRSATAYCASLVFTSRARLSRSAGEGEDPVAAEREESHASQGPRRSVLVVPMTLVPKESWSAVVGSSLAASTAAKSQGKGESGDGQVAASSVLQGSTELVATSEWQRQVAHSSFTSVVVLGEMLSEYTAILMIPFVLIMFEDQRLTLPFDYYAHVKEPFRNVPLDRWDLAKTSGIQLVSEVLVDSLCCFVESRRGHHLESVWRQARWLGPQLVWAAVLASSGASFFMQHHREVSLCIDDNMCTCPKAKLVAHSLREMYW